VSYYASEVPLPHSLANTYLLTPDRKRMLACLCGARREYLSQTEMHVKEEIG